MVKDKSCFPSTLVLLNFKNFFGAYPPLAKVSIIRSDSNIPGLSKTIKVSSSLLFMVKTVEKAIQVH